MSTLPKEEKAQEIVFDEKDEVPVLYVISVVDIADVERDRRVEESRGRNLFYAPVKPQKVWTDLEKMTQHEVDSDIVREILEGQAMGVYRVIHGRGKYLLKKKFPEALGVDTADKEKDMYSVVAMPPAFAKVLSGSPGYTPFRHRGPRK
ncbi:Hypothetical protein POVN_LOCUS13 [uncultured virus]|nr:Hypothetical protein POVN_LOCUS13 [uncultured virus]